MAYTLLIYAFLYGLVVNSDQLCVRSVRDEDLVDVAAIHRHYVEDSLICMPESDRTAAQWQELADDLQARALPFLVAEHQGTVGYAYVRPWRPGPSYRHTGEVSIYLAPGHANKQFGEPLMDELLATSEKAGMRQLIGTVVQSAVAPRTRTFARKYGFEECGLLKKVVFRNGHWLDVCLFQRQLSAPSGTP
ncbi:N-acetyltransferase family protein [Streptomyces sp. S1A(2023)]